MQVTGLQEQQIQAVEVLEVTAHLAQVALA
jgi:hypothetical protein